MAGRQEIRCIGPSVPLADRKASSQRSINLYMKQVEGLGEDKQVILESAPGLEAYLTMDGTIRGTYNADGRWFVVAATKLYEIVSGSAVELGTIDGSGYASMKHGRDQLVIASDAVGYVFNLNTDTLTQISSAGWRGSKWVEELDGYFVFVAPDTDQFYISAIDDGSTLDALDFSSADKQPDDIVTHRVLNGELLLMGTRSIEPWINSGDADFPFARYNANPIEIGVVGIRAACNISGGLVWVGQTDRGRGYVYEMRGHEPTRISHTGVEEALKTSTDLSECSLWSYHVEGAEFVCVNAPGMETTWVWEAATRQWHERARMTSGEWDAYPADHVTFFEGAHYVAHETKLYRMARDVYAIGSDELIRERTWPHLISPSLEPVSYRGLEIGCTTGSSTEGFITLEISNDGGHTFGAPLRRSLGVLGRFMQRVRWLMLGSSRDRVFRLRCSSAVPLTIHQAVVDA